MSTYDTETLKGEIYSLQRVDGGVVAQIFLPWPPSPPDEKEDAVEREKEERSRLVNATAAYIERLEHLRLGSVSVRQEF